jgi:hypothetical protein
LLSIFLQVPSVLPSKQPATPLNQDTLFPLTYSLAIFSFLLSLYWFRHEGILALPYAIGIPFLWVIFFEILWQNSFVFFGTLNDSLTNEVVLLSWLLPGTASFPEWRMDRISLIAFLTFSAGWVYWFASGYLQMPSAAGYLFNIPLKIGAFLAVLILVMPRKRPLHIEN